MQTRTNLMIDLTEDFTREQIVALVDSLGVVETYCVASDGEALAVWCNIRNWEDQDTYTTAHGVIGRIMGEL